MALIRKQTGTSQLVDFNAFVASASESVADRGSIVRERVAELEAELADLRQLERKLQAAAGTS